MIIEQSSRYTLEQHGPTHFTLTDKQYPSDPGFKSITFTHKHGGDLKRKVSAPLGRGESMEKRLAKIFNTADRQLEKMLGLEQGHYRDDDVYDSEGNVE